MTRRRLMLTNRIELKTGIPVNFKLYDNYGTGESACEVEAEYVSNELKLLFCARDGDIISYGKEYNEPLWRGDTVEAFVSLGRKDRYLELEVNPDGVKYAAEVENESDGKFRLKFLCEAPFEAETRRVEGGYESRWRISIPQLERLGLDRSDVRINLFMQDYRSDGLRLYALNPTLKDSFHVVSAFLKLDLV